MMFHEASYGALGEDPSIRSRMDFNSRYLDRLHREIADILGIPLKKYRAKIRDAWWVLASEAVSARFADAVVTGISYRKIETETMEIKRTVTKKKRRMVRPKDADKSGSMSFID
jgi:ATP-dependent protease ClpP protease subunit